MFVIGKLSQETHKLMHQIRVILSRPCFQIGHKVETIPDGFHLVHEVWHGQPNAPSVSSFLVLLVCHFGNGV